MHLPIGSLVSEISLSLSKSPPVGDIQGDLDLQGLGELIILERGLQQ